MAESGWPGVEVTAWNGVVVPAGTPAAIVRRVNAAMQKALSDPAVSERMAKLTIEPRIMQPEEFAAFLKKDVETAERLLKSAGVHLKE